MRWPQWSSGPLGSARFSVGYSISSLPDRNLLGKTLNEKANENEITVATHRKAAELLSATGAIMLGVGIGLAQSAIGGATALLLIAIGILGHG